MHGLTGDITEAAVSRTDTVIRVDAWLFGALSALSSERPLVLILAPGFTAGDVITRLGERLGEAFTTRVLAAPGEKFSHCRVFVDGYAVEHLDAPIATRGNTAEIEFILMIAPEGG